MAQEPDFVKSVSILLSLLAGDIVARIDLQDVPITDLDEPSTLSRLSTQPQPLAPFVREQINSLREQNSISAILSQIGQPKSSSRFSACHEDARPEDAKSLATYALTLLRVFPKKADEIRMWLYTGSLNLKSSTGISAISYFWQASRATAIFQNISRSHRNTLALLKPPSNTTDQIGRAPPSRQEAEAWGEEWRIILLFFELYTFVLKLMDDEEFLSGGAANTTDGSRDRGSHIKEGALPLKEVVDLTVFLKNLAFTLYWSASDLNASSASEESNSLGSYFGSAGHGSKEKISTVSKSEGLAGMLGVSTVYIKGLVTGLLRMLHERDSRRRFLPEGHWLMTSQVDMTGFIPAVTAEEEKRHEMQDDDDEEEEDGIDDDEIMNDESTLSNSRFLSGLHSLRRPQQARHFEALRRKQEKAKKKGSWSLLRRG